MKNNDEDERVISLEDFEKTKTEANAPTRTRIEEAITMKLRKDWEESTDSEKEWLLGYIKEKGFNNIDE
jgi:hypothetical protein